MSIAARERTATAVEPRRIDVVNMSAGVVLALFLGVALVDHRVAGSGGAVRQSKESARLGG